MFWLDSVEEEDYEGSGPATNIGQTWLESLKPACTVLAIYRGDRQLDRDPQWNNWFAELNLLGCQNQICKFWTNMKWIPGRVKDSDYYVNYDYEMWGKVIRILSVL